MRVTELIRQLERFRKTHGNARVVIDPTLYAGWDGEAHDLINGVTHRTILSRHFDSGEVRLEPKTFNACFLGPLPGDFRVLRKKQKERIEAAIARQQAAS